MFSSSTSVKVTPAQVSLTVNKNCSLLLDCSTPLNTETEWSVNRGFSKESHTQICCLTDNCNFQTLAGRICYSLLPDSSYTQDDISQSQMSQSRGQDTKMTPAYRVYISCPSMSVVPNPLANGKECPACASLNDSLAGTCNATLPCMGVEDSCFNGTSEFTLKFPSCGWALKQLSN